MGLRSWARRRILRGKGDQSTRAPAFERLEPRILLSGDIGTSSLVESADDSFVAYEDHVLVIPAKGVLANDTDAEGDRLKAIKVTDPAHGQLVLNPDGSFVYTPEADWWGRDRFTYKASDGLAESNIAKVNLLVFSVNDAPSFALGGDSIAVETAVPQTLPNWATAISAGPANESYQKLSFLLTNDNPALFSGQPSMSSDGALTFAPAPGAHGLATVTVQLRDNGGTVNGGVDTSSARSFTIAVSAANNAPVLDNTGTMWLSFVWQDDAANPGTLVTDILASAGGDRITDVDAGAVEGIAIIGANTDLGEWQSSTNAGATWTDLGSPSPSQARLLAADADTRLRFLPNARVVGTIDPAITFRAWDRTSGSNGGVADATAFGGAGAFSSVIGTAALEVKPVVRLPGDKGTNDVVVYRRGANLLMVNNKKQVLLNQPLASLNQLIIVGVPNKTDTVTVDIAIGGGFVLRDGLMFDGGSGKETDTLVLRGTARSDYYEIDTDLVVVNGLLGMVRDVEQIRLEGGAGDDSYAVFGLGVPITISDTGGTDVLDFSGATSGVTIDLSKSSGQWQQVLPGHARLALKGTIENVMVTSWSDLIIGNSANNRIWGGAGDDTIYGGAGDDWLFGGTGNDRLFGEAGNDVLLGGEGNDRIDAGTGNNLLIGGLGTDSLKGSSGEDIMIGGTTDYDADVTALRAIMAEWTARRSFITRIANLTRRLGPNGSYGLWLGRTVHDDRASDVLSGGLGSDWFLFFTTDTVTDRGSNDL